jgi:hypothetical protein
MDRFWNERDARAFNFTGHPTLGQSGAPEVIDASHAVAAPSPALVALYPAASDGVPSEPYPIVFVPASATVAVPSGFYVIANLGDEFVVRVGGRSGVDAICDAAGADLVLVNLKVDGKEFRLYPILPELCYSQRLESSSALLGQCKRYRCAAQSIRLSGRSSPLYLLVSASRTCLGNDSLNTPVSVCFSSLALRRLVWF